MSYGEVYIESDIKKLKKAGYKKQTIIRVISRRIKYRYSDIPSKDAQRIATQIYEGKNSDWRTKRRSSTQISITSKERKLWNKLNLDSI